MRRYLLPAATAFALVLGRAAVAEEAAFAGGLVVGLAVDRKGELYVPDRDARIKVFGPDGKYLRTIMPHPPQAGSEGPRSVNDDRKVFRGSDLAR